MLLLKIIVTILHTCLASFVKNAVKILKIMIIFIHICISVFAFIEIMLVKKSVWQNFVIHEIKRNFETCNYGN